MRVMSVCALIPARKDAQRFPAKLLQNLGNKAVILHTLHNALKTELFDQVVLTTDSDEIARIAPEGVAVFRSRKEHTSGSDRIAEASAHFSADIYINIQGDEPFLHKESLRQLINVFQEDETENISVASLMSPLEYADLSNPDRVKVVVNAHYFALYFSRSPIPFQRDMLLPSSTPFYKHIGIYGFRKHALQCFPTLPIGVLEKTEKIECLRFLEQGIPIKMVLTDAPAISIDSPKDLSLAAQYLTQYRL